VMLGQETFRLFKVKSGKARLLRYREEKLIAIEIKKEGQTFGGSTLLSPSSIVGGPFLFSVSAESQLCVHEVRLEFILRMLQVHTRLAQKLFFMIAKEFGKMQYQTEITRRIKREQTLGNISTKGSNVKKVQYIVYL